MASKRKHLKPGEKVVLSLTEEEASLITEFTYISEERINTIYFSKCRDGIVSARHTLSELEELAGYTAAEANNTKDKRLRKQLDTISERIEQLNLIYSDEDPPNRPVTQRRLVLVKR